jgi:hypothetical protein
MSSALLVIVSVFIAIGLWIFFRSRLKTVAEPNLSNSHEQSTLYYQEEVPANSLSTTQPKSVEIGVPSLPKQLVDINPQGSNDETISPSMDTSSLESQSPQQAEPIVPGLTVDAGTTTSRPQDELTVDRKNDFDPLKVPESNAQTLEAITSISLTAIPLPPLSVKPESNIREVGDLLSSDKLQGFNPPTYTPPTPPATKSRPSNSGQKTPRSTLRQDSDLRLRLQLVFGRGGVVKTLALVPDRWEGMSSDLELTDAKGKVRLIELSDDFYESIPLSEPSAVLRDGVEWRLRTSGNNYRWILSGRSVYVLAPGGEFGLIGYISIARLWLNTRHVVLTTETLRDNVLAALANAGCTDIEINEDQTSGVPFGWILIRDVTPTRAVPMRNEQDILNVLCPAHEIELHFAGGIRLERKVYLVGYPPRIRLTGNLGNDFQVSLDNQLIQSGQDGSIEAPGWDSEGEHRILFGDRVETYSLRTMEEGWDSWHAHDFGIGATICGAKIFRVDNTHWHQVRVPTTNPLLIGARPGEIFRCRPYRGVRSETILTLVPFTPVWAFPIDPIHADKRSSRLVLLELVAPIPIRHLVNRRSDNGPALRAWIAAVRDAGRKQLVVAKESEDAKILWRQYRALAKQLWRKMR